MRKIITHFLAAIVMLISSAGLLSGQQASDLFFSEYIEGSSFNKALEIYNGTGSSVDLSNYRIAIAVNGGGWSSFYEFPTGASITNSDVFVLAHASFNASLFDIANADVVSTASVINFNGDDARGLIKIVGTDTIWIDVFGNPDNDPGTGWAVGGVANSTADNTLVRKSSISQGNTNWELSFGTTLENSEWEIYPNNTADYLGSHTFGIQSASLILEVNMNYQITAGNFDPLLDSVDVAGSFNGWAGTAMTDADSDGIYNCEITGLQAGDTAMFKFRINADWNNAEFPNGPNRSYVLTAGVNDLLFWYNDNAGPQSVTFTVEDLGGTYQNIQMKGSYDSWVLHPMFDDGTNGDVVSGDNIWTCTLMIPGGNWEWGAVEVDGTTELWLIQGANLQFSVLTDGSVTGTTDYVIPAPGMDVMLLHVNMNYQISLGAFNPNTDIVDAAGSFNGFGGSGAMEDLDGDGIYSIEIDGLTAGNTYEFKFRINANWNTAEFPNGSNRFITIVGGGADNYTYWYNDEMPPAQPDLFFSEYIEGSSNNKALEIFNPTNDTIWLDTYQIAQSSNGGGWAFYHVFPAGASIAPGDVWTIITNQVNSALFASTDADEVLAFPSVVHYNGDDARALIKITGTDTTWLDIFGTPDFDPGTGWEVAGIANATANKTLVRKAEITIGNTDWAASAGTDATNSEWVVLDVDVFDYLGSHPHIFGATGDVTFHVNMSYQVSLGNFDPLVDFVDVAGSMTNWGGALMGDIDGDLVYSVTIENIPVGLIEFKFRINGDWTLAEFPGGGPNREYIVDIGTQEITYWFNDEQAPASTDLFFSEYIEGSSNNKGLEIYNPTSSIISLESYQIAQSSNGGGWQFYHTFPVGASIAPGDVWTIITNQVNSTLFVSTDADEVLPFPSVVHYNGDDARALIKISGTDTTWLDIFGTPDFDPGTGWEVAGVANATANKTLVRKESITSGNTDWALSAGTDALNSEWIVLDIDVFDYFGFHPHNFSATGTVSFNVNMSHQVTLGNFDTALDYVEVVGSFEGWTGTLLTDPDGDQIYSVTVENIVPGDIFFKFRINGDWANAEFPGGDDRTFNVTIGNHVLDFWYNDEQPVLNVSIYDIQFTTDPGGASPYVGQTIQTQGIVTAAYSNAYYIQDGAGPWTGVYVYSPGNTAVVGDSVLITGLVEEYYGVTEMLNISSFMVLNSGNTLPAPVVISTGTLSSDEAYEGVFVKVENAECTILPNNFNEWYVNDGSGDGQVDDVMFNFTPVLGNSYDIVGVVHYSFSNYELLPRSADDVVDVTVYETTQTITIPAGWSMFSTYIIPFEANIDSILNAFVSDVNIVKSGGGAIYWPSFGINTINDIVLGQGYQANMFATMNVDITGVQAVPENTEISLPAGWFIIGYLRDTPGNAELMFADLIGNLLIAKNATGQVYWPDFQLNSIGNLLPGSGYQINLQFADDFFYPANTSGGTKANVAPTSFMNTGSNMTLGIPNESWISEPARNSELLVYSKEGKLVGKTTYQGANTAISIWGVDELSNSGEGLKSNESFELRLVTNGTERKISIDSWIKGDGNYKTDDIQIIGKLNVENGFNLINAWPNPATANLNLEFTTNDSAPVAIRVFNILGEQVAHVYPGIITSGQHLFSLPVSGLAPGTYLYQITQGNESQTGKFEVIR